MPRPVHRSQARLFLVGLPGLAVILAVAWVGITVQGGGELPAKPYTYVTAAFDDVGTLKERQDVNQNGSRIGEVHAIEYRDSRAIVTLRLDGDRTVYRDARARVGNVSLLGRQYVDLDPGTPAAGPLGDRAIPPNRTSRPGSLDDTLSAFDQRTRAGLRSVLRELGGGLAGHGEDLRDAVRAAPQLLTDTGEISDALASEQADLPALLTAANRLAGRFQDRQQELSSLLDRTTNTVRAITVDDGRPLSETLQALPATLRQARRSLHALDKPLADLGSAMATVRPGARALATAEPDLRGFLREAVHPLRKVPRVARLADPAVRDLTHTFADLRPLAPRAARTVADARVFLRDLSPYAPDMGRLLTEHDLLSAHFPTKRYPVPKHLFALALVMPGPYATSLPDPTTEMVPYPEPGGGAWRDHQTGGGR